MYCSRCGVANEANARFCTACGAPLLPAGEPPSRMRPTLVLILAILNFIGGACQLLLGLALLVWTLSSPAIGEARTILGVFGLGMIALGALSTTCGYGLLKVRPYGRTIQLVYSWIGLLGFPVGTVVHALILVYLYRPGIRVLFSRKPLDELSPEEARQLRALGNANAAAVAVGVVAVFFGGVAFTGIVAAIAIPNLLNAIDRGKQKRTLADIRSIGTAIESYAVDRNAYPVARDLPELATVLEPVYIKTLPRKDGWGNPLIYEPRSGTGYEIGSGGKDGGALDRIGEGGATTNFNDAILFTDGEFVQWPEGTQR